MHDLYIIEGKKLGNPNPVSKSWVAVFDEFGNIVDWVCPRCHKNINYDIWSAAYCPWCGLTAFSYPRGRIDGPFSRDARSWENFIFENRLIVRAGKPNDRRSRKVEKHDE